MLRNPIQLAPSAGRSQPEASRANSVTFAGLRPCRMVRPAAATRDVSGGVRGGPFVLQSAESNSLAVPSLRRRLVVGSLLALAYLLPFPYQPGVQNPNENVRLFMTAAMVEQSTYAIDSIRSRWGWVNDAAIHGGKVYSVKAPGTSMLAAPAYAVWYHLAKPATATDDEQSADLTDDDEKDESERTARVATEAGNGSSPPAPTAKSPKVRPWQPDRATATWIVRIFGNALPMWVFFWFLYPWLGRRTGSPVIRDSVFWSLALGSCLYAYSLILVSHAVAAAAGFGALMLLQRARPIPGEAPLTATGVFFAGLLAASVTAFEYPGFPISALLCMYGALTVGSARRLLLLCAGALVPVALVMHFHDAAFGNPWTPGHLHMEDPNFRAVHHHGFFGADRYHPDAARGLLVAPGYGLLPMTPLLVAGAWGFLVLLWRERSREAGLVAFLCAFSAYALACFLSNWRGGWTVGPRYLAWIYPMLGWAALSGLDALHKRLPGVATGYAIGALVVGLVVSGVPAVIYPHVPEAFIYPLPQLFAPLLSADFASATAFNRLGLYGVASVVPLAVLGCAIVVVTATADAPWNRLKRAEIGPKVWLLVRFVGAGVTASLILSALLYVPDNLHPTYRIWARDSLKFVAEAWTPAGKDTIAKLIRKDASVGIRDEERYELAHTLRQVGRFKDAAAHMNKLPARMKRPLVARWIDEDKRWYTVPKPPTAPTRPDPPTKPAVKSKRAEAQRRPIARLPVPSSPTGASQARKLAAPRAVREMFRKQRDER